MELAEEDGFAYIQRQRIQTRMSFLFYFLAFSLKTLIVSVSGLSENEALTPLH